MSRESLVLLIGALLFFIPWLGVPEAWKFYAISAFGAMLVALGFLLRRAAYLRKIARGAHERGTDSFTESTAPQKGGANEQDLALGETGL